MLTREHAIMVIKQYRTKEDSFLFNFLFPKEFIPKDLNMEGWRFKSALQIKKDMMLVNIERIIHNYFVDCFVLDKTERYIEFTNVTERINLIEMIEELNNLQNNFDEKEKNNELELNELIELINKIKEYEYFIIDEAEKLLKLKEDIDACVYKYGIEINEKNNWI